MTETDPPFASYVLCATPRSGTTLLCDLLESTGVAGRPASYFRAQSIPRWAERLEVPTRHDWQDGAFDHAYLAAVARRAAAGTGIAGFRLMWESVAALSARLDALFPGLPDDAARFGRAFERTLYVHVSRRDKVAQAVSRVRAQQTGLWHVAADGTERERTAPPAEPHYDHDAIAHHVEELIAQDAAWRRWFDAQGVVPIPLTYENLACDPAAAVAQILSALGADADASVRVGPRTTKMGDAASAGWIARFRSAQAIPRMNE